MKVLNFGSLNIDYVYRVPHIVEPGETLASRSLRTFAGGKGANQSVALARAGAETFHAGKVGPDGKWLVEKLSGCSVNTEFIRVDEAPTGHAIIQVDEEGQNAIVLFPGANHRITREMIDETLARFTEGDLLLLQNEINEIPYLMESGHARGMKICFNPAPFGKEILSYPLNLIDILVANETEGMSLARTDIEAALMYELHDLVPRAEILLTLGETGVVYRSDSGDLSLPAPKVTAVDTTAAGDTFIGYYLASLCHGHEVKRALEIACQAGALCVTRQGAMDSIPSLEEVAAMV